MAITTESGTEARVVDEGELELGQIGPSAGPERCVWPISFILTMLARRRRVHLGRVRRNTLIAGLHATCSRLPQLGRAEKGRCAPTGPIA